MTEQDVWEIQLKAALLLVRDFRYKAYVQELDPRAARVALKYALLVDDYLAVEHGISTEEENQLTVLAQKLFNETPKVAVATTKAVNSTACKTLGATWPQAKRKGD